MGMLDRYKKKGGFVQLLNLLETTPQPKKEKFLKLIQDESAEWEAELQKKMLTMDRVCKWSTQNLMEILPRIPYNIVAIAMMNLSEANKNALLSAYSHFDKRKIEDTWRDTAANPGEILTCQQKILTEIRNLAKEGHLKFEAVDPEMVIQENIEDALNAGAALGDIPDLQFPSDGPQEGAATGGPQSHGVNPQVIEELSMLKRKVANLSQENHKLNQQLNVYKDKLEQIKKIA
jgi:FliG C-terminal domain